MHSYIFSVYFFSLAASAAYKLLGCWLLINYENPQCTQFHFGGVRRKEKMLVI